MFWCSSSYISPITSVLQKPLMVTPLLINSIHTAIQWTLVKSIFFLLAQHCLNSNKELRTVNKAASARLIGAARNLFLSRLRVWNAFFPYINVEGRFLPWDIVCSQLFHSHGIVHLEYKKKRLTVFKYCLSAASIYFLPPDQETCGVSKVNVSQFGVVVYGSGVDQVLDGLHVLVAGLDIHIKAPNDARTPLPVEQEEIILGLYKTRKDRAFF